MIKVEPIIAVQDVEKSSNWYQEILGAKSSHGGDEFEILTNAENQTILCLHKWGEHDHPTLSSPSEKNGNGLILYVRVDDLDAIWQNANKANATIEYAPRLNPNSGEQEFAIRDIDGYYLLISN